jgi:hypothetical protein
VAGAARQSGENVELLNSWLKSYYKIARSLGRNRFHKFVFMLRHQNNLDRCHVPSHADLLIRGCCVGTLPVQVIFQIFSVTA